MPKGIKHYPQSRKDVKRSVGKGKSKEVNKLYRHLGKAGNKLRKKGKAKNNIMNLGRILEGPRGGQWTPRKARKEEY
jgi:hypothetical protein